MSEEQTADILNHVDLHPGYAKVNFYDLSPLWMNPEAKEVIFDQMAAQIAQYKPTVILGIEARGFSIAEAMSARLSIGWAMARKADAKLPDAAEEKTYGTEYDEQGAKALKIQTKWIKANDRVAIVDDLMATGGTVRAAADAVREHGAEPVIAACLVELEDLGGKDTLGFSFFSSVKVPANPVHDKELLERFNYIDPEGLAEALEAAENPEIAAS